MAIKKSMLPRIQAGIVMPEILSGSARFKRAHNQIVKECVREEIDKHHRKRIPGHFKQTARSKYGHYKRKTPYKAIKKRTTRSITDLVKSGKSKHAMTHSRQITIAGSARTGIIGTLRMRWPFPVRRVARGVGVTPDKMAQEITRVTVIENFDILRGFNKRYMKKLNDVLKQKKRMQAPNIRLGR